MTLVLLVNTSTLQKKVDKHLYKFYDEIVLLENKQVFLDGHIFNITGKTDRVYVGCRMRREMSFVTPMYVLRWSCSDCSRYTNVAAIAAVKRTALC